MQVKPPRVPRAAQIAGNATSGPRVLPGTYTVRLTRGGQTVETKLVIGLDRRAPYTTGDRKEQFEAAMKAHALFGDMTDMTDKIDGARGAITELGKKLGASDALAGKLRDVGAKLDDVKQLIVATKEGGAITGEERIREHLDTAYGAIMRWEGKPAKYQVDAVATLRRELDDAGKQLKAVADGDLKSLDDELKKRNLPPIAMVAATPNPLEDEATVECIESAGRDCGSEAATATERD